MAHMSVGDRAHIPASWDDARSHALPAAGRMCVRVGEERPSDAVGREAVEWPRVAEHVSLNLPALPATPIERKPGAPDTLVVPFTKWVREDEQETAGWGVTRQSRLECGEAYGHRLEHRKRTQRQSRRSRRASVRSVRL